MCRICGETKPLESFHIKKTTKDGRQTQCAECKKQYNKKHYKDHGYKWKDARAESRDKLVHRNQNWALNYLSNHPCVDCGSCDIRVLEFDHVRGEKVCNVSKLICGGQSMKRLIEEVNKCEIRCRNCHIIKTYERLGGSYRDKFLIE